MEKETALSFIIVNYNSKDFLDNCIYSIRKNASFFNYEIIVANNDPLAIDIPGVIAINLGKNKGFGAGCNAGAKIAKGKILCFLNPGTEILDNIDAIANYLIVNIKAGAVGPRLINDKGETQYWCAGNEPSLWDLIKNNLGLYGSKKIWESKLIIQADWVSGACCFIKKEIFDQVGGFDEKFFMYFEDVDLCKRIRNNNYQVFYYPLVSVKHMGSKSFRSKFIQKKIFHKSLIYYFKKHNWRNSELSDKINLR